MAASYPTSIAVFPTHNDITDTIFAADINNPNAEIAAIEAGLLNGFQHPLFPLVAAAQDLGSVTKPWNRLFLTTGQVMVDPTVCDGRLTLTTALPVTTADVTAATTLFWTPYKGNRVTLFDGVSAWNMRVFAELSIGVPATTSQMYDVFVFDNAGAPALELLAWTNDTTRATALVLQDGVLCKSGALTRRYLGSFRTTAVAGQTEDSLLKRYVWNYYNRVRRALGRQETTATWTYTTLAFRQANANTANQVEVVVGVAEVMAELHVAAMANNTSGAVSAAVAIGVDSTIVAQAGLVGGEMTTVGTGTTATAQVSLRIYPPIGRHFFAWLEKSQAVGTTTWFATNLLASNSGIDGSIEG